MIFRPHHALCMQFFEGKGYSDEFNKQMEYVLSLPDDTSITITDTLDSLCEHCPNHPTGICDSQNKVSRYDTNVSTICEFKTGSVMTLGAFKTIAKEKIIDAGIIKDVCSDCEFLYICDKN